MSAPGAWPRPLLSALVAGSWLLLNQSLSLPQLITAAVLAWGLPKLLHGFLGPTVQVHAWGTLLRLAGVVLWDIVLSNFTVARLVLQPGARPQPLWVPVPLDIQHPLAVSLFATIITTTPGTVSCVVDLAGRQILVHALDGADPAAMAQQMKQRYEQPLREIFEP
jgi:multicomponent K+:H+ antiporter subunit E